MRTYYLVEASEVAPGSITYQPIRVSGGFWNRKDEPLGNPCGTRQEAEARIKATVDYPKPAGVWLYDDRGERGGFGW